MAKEVVIYASALQKMMMSANVNAFLAKTGTDIRDRARQNAGVFASPEHTSAITYEVGRDDEGPYVDIGYMRHHPGFFLWWWEVGTKNHKPRPHLRPALSGALGLVEYTSKSGKTSYITEKQAANYTRNRKS